MKNKIRIKAVAEGGKYCRRSIIRNTEYYDSDPTIGYVPVGDYPYSGSHRKSSVGGAL